VASAGDLNVDGYDDVIVGDWSEHVAVVFYGSSSGVTSSTGRWLITGPPDNVGFFGGHVASAGDLDGNGFPDIAIGAYMRPPSPYGMVVLYTVPGSAGVPSPDTRGFVFHPPSPNPGVRGFELTLDLPQASDVVIEVLDLAGRRVALPVSEHANAGRWSRSWRPERLPTGCYLVRARAGEERRVRRVVWLGGR